MPGYRFQGDGAAGVDAIAISDGALAPVSGGAPGRSPPRRRARRVPCGPWGRPSDAPLTSGPHVRGTLRPVRRHLQAPSWQGQAPRGGRRGGPAGDPRGAARGRRRLHRGPHDAGAHPRAHGRDRDLRGAEPGPAGHQDRPRRAHRGARRRGDQDQLRQPAADGGADGGPAGLRQDHQLRQAGPLVQAAGPQPAARRGRPPAARRRRAAAHPGPPDRRARVLPARRSGRDGGGRPRRGPPARAGRADRRHRRPPGHRRRAHGAGAPDLRRPSRRTTPSSSSTR